MPTSDGISDADWDQIHDNAAAIVAASGEGADTSFLISRLLKQLDYLEGKYGRLPSLLATRADYVDDGTAALSLLKEAFVVSLELADFANTTEICLSVIEVYSELDDGLSRKEFWIGVLRKHLAIHPSADAIEQLARYDN